MRSMVEGAQSRPPDRRAAIADTALPLRHVALRAGATSRASLRYTGGEPDPA